jgi:hypothetical protein
LLFGSLQNMTPSTGIGFRKISPGIVPRGCKSEILEDLPAPQIEGRIIGRPLASQSKMKTLFSSVLAFMTLVGISLPARADEDRGTMIGMMNIGTTIRMAIGMVTKDVGNIIITSTRLFRSGQ